MSEQRSTLATCLVAPNSGPMTLDGTNTYVIRAPGSRTAVVVDPGPSVRGHINRIEALGPVDLVLLTHHHHDHAESATELSERTGASVRAWEPTLCIGAGALRDGETIVSAGARIVVIATPGHTSDSVCFQLPDDRAVGSQDRTGSILTGDTILGRGFTILAQSENAVRDYLTSLESLRALDDAQLVLPAHGPALPSLRVIADEYLAHRRDRLAHISAALVQLDPHQLKDQSVISAITDAVYPEVSDELRLAAEASTAAQLQYLADRRR
ncbi:Glyoxylase, beta-lactamase superfamily II [Microbacterium pygmaeum]|uniref:Glyoxylase, beta-lactamase superfamily II n=2 Tax=Microbacterium pygmaeum TaxID=370764 RepID=A0A1G7XFG0_9MICO|nr:Glyoxylase, beta-lactamase superfamily II [Microbacterium pygmaeum]